MSQQPPNYPFLGVRDSNNYADDSTISITFSNPTPIGLKIFISIFVLIAIGGIKPLLSLVLRWKQRRLHQKNNNKLKSSSHPHHHQHQQHQGTDTSEVHTLQTAPLSNSQQQNDTSGDGSHVLSTTTVARSTTPDTDEPNNDNNNNINTTTFRSEIGDDIPINLRNDNGPYAPNSYKNPYSYEQQQQQQQQHQHQLQELQQQPEYINATFPQPHYVVGGEYQMQHQHHQQQQSPPALITRPPQQQHLYARSLSDSVAPMNHPSPMDVHQSQLLFERQHSEPLEVAYMRNSNPQSLFVTGPMNPMGIKSPIQQMHPMAYDNIPRIPSMEIENTNSNPVYPSYQPDQPIQGGSFTGMNPLTMMPQQQQQQPPLFYAQERPYFSQQQQQQRQHQLYQDSIYQQQQLEMMQTTIPLSYRVESSVIQQQRIEDVVPSSRQSILLNIRDENLMNQSISSIGESSAMNELRCPPKPNRSVTTTSATTETEGAFQTMTSTLKTSLPSSTNIPSQVALDDCVSDIPSSINNDGLQRRSTTSSGSVSKRQNTIISSKSLHLWPSSNKPVSRQETLSRSLDKERQYVQQMLLMGIQQHDEMRSNNNNYTSSQESIISNGQSPIRSNRCDAAEQALRNRANDPATADTEAEYYRRKFRPQQSFSASSVRSLFSDSSSQHQQQQQISPQRRSRRQSVESSSSYMETVSVLESTSGMSAMGPLPMDAIFPSDAKSINAPDVPYQNYLARLEKDRIELQRLDATQKDIPEWLASLLDIVEIDHESKRILKLAVSPTMGAVSDPLFRLLLFCLVARFLDTSSMIAYLVVNLILRLTTEEISNAITGAESNMLQEALLNKTEYGSYQAGRFMQLAMTMQVVIGTIVLILWVFCIEGTVNWLLHNDIESVDTLAHDYTTIILVDYITRGVSKTFMLPFYITGQAQFEGIIDFIGMLLIVVAITVTAKGSEKLSLTSVATIQVVVGFAKAITKFTVVLYKGWLYPLKKGLIGSLCVRDMSAVRNFFFHLRPQFLGSIVELREWDLLVLFVRHLGSGEVVTWCMMGVIWEVFVTITDGLGEASLVRISFYLGEGMPQDAQRLSHKILCMACVLVLLVTSGFLMIGPTIARLVKNETLVDMFTDLVGMTGLANVSVTTAQIYWSLAGAQGRFELASATILFCRWLIVLPFSGLMVFHFHYDPIAVAGMVAVGYATAAGVLSYSFFSSNWEELSRSMQAQMKPRDGVYMDGPPIAPPQTDVAEVAVVPVVDNFEDESNHDSSDDDGEEVDDDGDDDNEGNDYFDDGSDDEEIDDEVSIIESTVSSRIVV